jgi:hypothetical protein
VVVLAAADNEPPARQVDVVAVERDRLTDPHPGHGQQPDQRLVGGGTQRGTDRAGCPHELRDLGFGVQIRNGAAGAGRQ